MVIQARQVRAKYGDQLQVQKMDSDTRYYIDIDVKSWKVVNRGYGDRFKLMKELPKYPIHRVFLTKGQYTKLVREAEPIQN